MQSLTNNQKDITKSCQLIKGENSNFNDSYFSSKFEPQANIIRYFICPLYMCSETDVIHHGHLPCVNLGVLPLFQESGPSEEHHCFVWWTPLQSLGSPTIVNFMMEQLFFLWHRTFPASGVNYLNAEGHIDENWREHHSTVRYTFVSGKTQFLFLVP